MSGDTGMGMSFGFNTGNDGPRPGAKPGEDAPQLSSVGGPITYTPLPLRILALANFCGAPDVRVGALHRLTDKTDLEALPGTLGVQLFFDVEDLLRGDSKGIEVRYQPQTLSDLRPAAVAKGIPAFDLVHKLLDEMQAVEQGQMTAGQFTSGLSLYAEIPALEPALGLAQKALGGSAPAKPAAAAPAKPSAPAAGSGDATIDSILSMVAAPGEDASEPPAPPPKKPSALGGLVSAVAASARGGGAPSASGKLGAARQAVQAVIAAQLGKVFAHPQFQQVEAAWLGLKLLVERADLRKGVKIDVCDADPEAPADTFHAHVFPAEYEGRSDHPLSLTIVDFAFKNSAADQAALEQLAADAEQIQAPVVVAVGEEFLGVESMTALGGMDNARSVFETGFERWHAFRKTEPARWLVAATNRILARAPYRAGSRRSPHYGEGDAERRWLNPGWALGVTVARSHSELGWPTSIGGPNHGRVEDLTLVETAPTGPLEAQLGQRVVEDLAEHGIVGLTHESQRDAALVIRTPTARALESGEPRERVNLAYQLFAAKLGETVLRNKPRLVQGAGGPAEIKARFETFLSGVVGDTGPGAGASVKVVQANEGTIIEMTIRVGRAVLGGAELSLGVRA